MYWDIAMAMAECVKRAFPSSRKMPPGADLLGVVCRNVALALAYASTVMATQSVLPSIYPTWSP